MIKRRNGDIIFECDSCDDYFDSETVDFTDAWDAAKREGWKSRKIADQWVHACPNCET